MSKKNTNPLQPNNQKEISLVSEILIDNMYSLVDDMTTSIIELDVDSTTEALVSFQRILDVQYENFSPPKKNNKTKFKQQRSKKPHKTNIYPDAESDFLFIGDSTSGGIQLRDFFDRPLTPEEISSSIITLIPYENQMQRKEAIPHVIRFLVTVEWERFEDNLAKFPPEHQIFLNNLLGFRYWIINSINQPGNLENQLVKIVETFDTKCLARLGYTWSRFLPDNTESITKARALMKKSGCDKEDVRFFFLGLNLGLTDHQIKYDPFLESSREYEIRKGLTRKQFVDFTALYNNEREISMPWFIDVLSEMKGPLEIKFKGSLYPERIGLAGMSFDIDRADIDGEEQIVGIWVSFQHKNGYILEYKIILDEEDLEGTNSLFESSPVFDNLILIMDGLIIDVARHKEIQESIFANISKKWNSSYSKISGTVDYLNLARILLCDKNLFMRVDPLTPIYKDSLDDVASFRADSFPVHMRKAGEIIQFSTIFEHSAIGGLEYFIATRT